MVLPSSLEMPCILYVLENCGGGGIMLLTQEAVLVFTLVMPPTDDWC